MSLEQFMRRRGTGILLLVNGALLAGGAYLWVDSQGELRNVAWVPPEAQAPSISAVGLPAGVGGGEADVNRFVATTDRPLFSPSRRPPPPPPPPAPPKPVDPLADIQLFGVYGGKESGGILAKFNGKIQRVRLNDPVGEWTVKEVNGRDVTFARGDETRVMHLAHVIGPRPATAQVAAVAANPGVPLDRQAMQQQAMDEARERLRQRNELFRKAGLPPVKE